MKLNIKLGLIALLFITCKSEEIQMESSNLTSITETADRFADQYSRHISITRESGRIERVEINEQFVDFGGFNFDRVFILNPVYQDERLVECSIELDGMALTPLKFEYLKDRIWKISSDFVIYVFEYDKSGILTKKTRGHQIPRELVNYNYDGNKVNIEQSYERSDFSAVSELSYQGASNHLRNNDIFLMLQPIFFSSPAYDPVDFYFHPFFPESVHNLQNGQKDDWIYAYDESGVINSIQTSWADWTFTYESNDL